MATAGAPVQCRIIAEKVVPDENGNLVKTGEKQVNEWEPQGEEAAYVRDLLISQEIKPPDAADKEGEEINGNSNS